MSINKKTLDGTKSGILIEQGTVTFQVVKDDYYFMTPIITKEDIVQLVANNRLTEAVKYINENTSKEIVTYFYDLAKQYFYEKKYDEAEIIYQKLIPLNTSETVKISDKSEFDLRLVYINKQEYKKAITFKQHGRLIAFNNTTFISVLLIGLCQYQLAEKIFSEITQKFSIEDKEKLKKSLVDLYEDRYQKSFDNPEILYKKIGFFELNKISSSTGIDINILKKNVDQLNEYFHYLREYQDKVKYYFIKKDNIDYKKLELNYLVNIPINEVDYEIVEDKYIDYFQKYFIEKAIFLQKNNCDIITSIDQYDFFKTKYFDNIEIVINAGKLSYDQIFYALLKREIFFGSTLQSFALFRLIQDKSIINDNILNIFLITIPLFQCHTSYLDEIYKYFISRKTNKFSYMTEYGIYKLGKQNKEMLFEAQQLLATVVKNKTQVTEVDYVFALLGLLHSKYLLNPEDLTTINYQYINLAKKALQLIINSKYSKDYIYNPGFGLVENLKGLINKINLLFDHDLKLVFLESVINIIKENSDIIEENMEYFKKG